MAFAAAWAGQQNTWARLSAETKKSVTDVPGKFRDRGIFGRLYLDLVRAGAGLWGPNVNCLVREHLNSKKWEPDA